MLPNQTDQVPQKTFEQHAAQQAGPTDGMRNWNIYCC